MKLNTYSIIERGCAEMVILEDDLKQPLRTAKQEALIFSLLESSTFTKSQRDKLVNDFYNKVITSYDANVFIGKLLAEVRYFKHFFKERHRKVAECAICGERIGVKKCLDTASGKKRWLCELHAANPTAEVQKVVEPAVEQVTINNTQ